MPVKIQIDGVGTVEVDDSFASLATEQQDAIIREIVDSSGVPQPAPASSRAVVRTNEPAPVPATPTEPAPTSVPVTTREQEIQEIARQNIEQRQQANPIPVPDWLDNFSNAVNTGASRAMFGLPERLDAAFRHYTGINSQADNYQDELAIVRAETNENAERSPGGNFIGEIGGATAGGGLAAGAVEGAGRALGSNVLQGLTQLRQGQNIRNLTKLTGAGAAAGAAQAAGEGSDVGEGALIGTAAGALPAVGFKVGEVVTRPFRDMLRMTSADQFLRRFTTATPQELEQTAARIRQERGHEPSLFEVLPLRDQNRVLARVVQDSPDVIEGGNQVLAERLANVGPEMRQTVRTATRDQRRGAQRQLTDDLAAARGEDPTTADARAAVAASQSPVDFQRLYRQEARSIMEPFDDSRVADSLDDLYFQVPQNSNGTISFADGDPEMNAQIRSVAETLARRTKDQGINVRDVTEMVSSLSDDIAKGGIEGRAAERASRHLMDMLDERVPAASDATTRMREAFAAKSRMAEGMQAGWGGGLRDTRQPGTSRRQAQLIENAFDTPEGSTGRMLGQSNRLIDDLSGSDEEALRAIQGLARGGTSRAVRANLGRETGDTVMTAARSQEEGLESLARAARYFKQNEGTAGGAAQVRDALVAMHPDTFVTARIGAVMRFLTDASAIPENRARTIVEMIFSQDRNLVDRAINALGRERGGAEFIAGLPAILAQSGPSAETPIVEEVVTETPVVEEEYVDDGTPYGRAVVEGLFPGAVVTDDMRDPNSDLGRANPGSHHVNSDGAVDLRPIPGMTFEQFVQQLTDEGYEVIEAIDETKNPSPHATGPHWHIVLR